MARKRPKGVFALGWAAIEAALSGRTEHTPTAHVFPENLVRRTTFTAGGGHGWSISALETPRDRPAPWKIVVITGAPSWAEYWAETLAELPDDREMIVVDRPGYANSEPLHPVTDIRVQAEALAPVLQRRPGQKVLLVGQSYGAAIASIMADRNPGKVHGLVLLSGFFGEAGPTAQLLLGMGSKALGVIPRDLRHAVIEVTGQKPQLRHARKALARVNIPIHMIHGDMDDFAPLEVAEKLAEDTVTRRPIRVVRTEGANHFLNDGPAEQLIAALESCIPHRNAGWSLRLPKLPPLWPFKLPKAAQAQPG
ncbi:MAG: alpha/beta fold hydrolase [Pseudomonadota bacterium]